MERLPPLLRNRTRYHVSIHAPRNGATPFHLKQLFIWKVSIHAPRNGATGRSAGNLQKSEWFQFTLHVMERLSSAPPETYVMSFQFTLHVMERHRLHRERRLRYIVSIHAPRNGATYVIVAYREIRRVSIHAPRNGATVEELQ